METFDTVPSDYKPLSDKDDENMKLCSCLSLSMSDRYMDINEVVDDPKYAMAPRLQFRSLVIRTSNEERLLHVTELVDATIRRYDNMAEHRRSKPQISKL